MTFILPSFGASAISAVPASGGGGGGGGWSNNSYALSLDGADDYVALGNSSALAPSSITISAWIKVSGTVDTFNYIVSRAGSTYGSYHLRYTSANKFNVHLGFTSSQFKNDITSSSTYTLTDWHHVAFTYDQTNAKLYVDGVEEYSGAETRAIDYTAGSAGTDTHIGKSGGTLNYASPSEGLIDEVAIFNSALSASDITSIYNSGTPDDLSSYSPVGWWRMGDNDSGTGTTITDQGSGGNDGTLTNGPTFSTDVPVAPLTNTYSLSLDAVDDYATTATSVLNFYNTGGSISAWIKPSSVTATQTNPFQNRSIISKADVYLALNINEAGYPTLYFYDGAVREVVATTQVSTSSWMHICATWSTTGSAIYVNGTSEATSSNTPADIDSGQTAGNVYIGRTQNSSPDYFGGLIDELAVFNTELSSSNVTSIYNSGTPDDISSFSPVNWWRMGDNDGGTGTTITDQGSGGNDGTLTNGPTFATDTP